MVSDESLPSPAAVKQINLDIGRTFGTHMDYITSPASPSARGRERLQDILLSLARYNADVAYCQGMNFLAAVLSMHMSDDDAFWVFATFLESKKYLHGFYTPDLASLLVSHYIDIYSRELM